MRLELAILQDPEATRVLHFEPLYPSRGGPESVLRLAHPVRPGRFDLLEDPSKVVRCAP